MATVFEMIIDGTIPSTKIYEDDICLAILDINPIEKGHTLVISKKCYPVFSDAPAEVLSHMMQVAVKVDQKQREVLGSEGSNILINNGKASGQEVPHLHIHVIPRKSSDGQTFGFKHASYAEGEAKALGDQLRI